MKVQSLKLQSAFDLTASALDTSNSNDDDDDKDYKGWKETPADFKQY